MRCGELEGQRTRPDPGKYMGRMSGPDKSTRLNGQAAVRAGTTNQAKLKPLRHELSAFDALNPPGWSDGRLIGPLHHSVWCLPLNGFHLRKLHLFPSLDIPVLA